jgi:hypothetical protein
MKTKMTTRWMWRAGLMAWIMAVSPQSLLAQGDGPRTHWKEMLTDTNIVNLTYLHASGNVNPLDPSYSLLLGVDADFTADLALVGYSRSFSLFDRTAVASALWPVGELQADTTTLMTTTSESARGFGDPILQLDVNLIGAPAMRGIPDLMRYEPKFTLDFVANLAMPIGEYDGGSSANIGQNRWYGRVGLPMMYNLGEWVPGRRTTLEFLPAVWFFGDNDDFLGQNAENDPLIQLEGHLTRDFTEKFWGSLDAIYYAGGESTIGALTTTELDDLAVGFTFGWQVNDNLMLTAGYTVTTDDGMDAMDLGVFRVNLVTGWHKLLEGMERLQR